MKTKKKVRKMMSKKKDKHLAMAIKFADEIIEEIKNRQPAAVTDVSVDSEEYERWLYEEEKEKKDNNIYL